MKKKLILLCVLCCLVLGLAVNAYAAGTPTISVGTAEATAGNEVTVPIVIENSPGVASFNMQLNYDKSKLSYVNKVAGLLNPTANGENDTGLPVGYMNGDGVNITGDGTLFSIIFKIADGTEAGDINITLSVTAFSDEDYTVTASAITPINGKVTVQDHTHTYTTEPVTPGTAATCKDSGTKDIYGCTGCDVEFIKDANGNFVEATDTNKVISVLTDDSAHTWNAGVQTKAPTCSAKGVKTFTCSVCGATKTEDIDINPAAHTEASIKQFSPAVDPSCADGGTDGQKGIKQCDDCKKFQVGDKWYDNQDAAEAAAVIAYDPADPAAHAHMELKTAGKAATTTAEGTKDIYYCADCETEYVQVKAADGTITYEAVKPDGSNVTIPKLKADTTDDKNDEKKSPKTGDETNIALWVTLFVFCAATATVVILTKKAKKNN